MLEKLFIKTVVSQGQINPNNADFLNLQNSNFISNLYNNLLDRSGDDLGLKFWANELILGSSRADIVESFVNSIKADTKDGEIFAAKIATADDFTKADFADNSQKIFH